MNRLRRVGGAARRWAVLAATFPFLGACARNEDMPGIPWLIGAAVRSLAGAPPTPPDFYAEPMRISDTPRFTAITAGGEHTCALTVDGDTYCWGSNRFEQLGSAAMTEACGSGAGTFPCSSVPVRLQVAPRFTALAASRWSTCGLDASGVAHCWGYGLGGRAGSGLPASSGVPVEVPSEHPFVALASNASSNGGTCGLTPDGRVSCWGFRESTDGGGESELFAGPAVVPTGLKFVSISFGGHHGCGIDEARNAHCWGNNDLGALGVGSSWYQGGIRESLAPVPVQGGLKLQEVVAAAGYSCGLSLQGSAYCWGLGYPVDGSDAAPQRLSGNPLPHGALPIPIEMSGSSWTTLRASDTQTCGLAENGKVYCFRATPLQGVDRRPVEIESDQTFVQLAVGNGHACAIGSDAFAYCWGDSSSGQAGRAPSGRRW